MILIENDSQIVGSYFKQRLFHINYNDRHIIGFYIWLSQEIRNKIIAADQENVDWKQDLWFSRTTNLLIMNNIEHFEQNEV